MKPLHYSLALVAFSLCAFGTVGPAQDTVTPKPQRDGLPKDGPRKGVPMPGFSPAREAAALSFVQQHHAELSGVLSSLKAASLEEYKRAIQELFRTSERLAMVKESDEERYEMELSHWKAGSRIRLLAARLTMSSGEDVEQQLRQAVHEQVDLKIKLQELERDRSAARLAKMESNLAELKKSKDKHVDRTFKQLTDSAKTARQKRKNAAAAKGADQGQTPAKSEAERGPVEKGKRTAVLRRPRISSARRQRLQRETRAER